MTAHGAPLPTAGAGPEPTDATLPPYPEGWYCLGFSRELAPGAVLTRQVAGQEVVLFRTAKGEIGVLDAHCPHLGAHLGVGGVVVDEHLRCPFHGFCFDAKGTCVKTGYDTRPPPRAHTRAWPVLERHGLLLVYWHPERTAPTWQVPDVDTTDWTELRWQRFRIATHVQEIAENSVDVGHFSWVHGYTQVGELAPLRTEGPLLHAHYTMHRPRQTLGLGDGVTVQFEIFQYGLGYARVEVTVPKQGLRLRHFVLARPFDDTQVELTIAVSVQRITHGARLHPLAALVPNGWLTQIVARSALVAYAADVGQDVPIWHHKRYVAPPALAQGDGPVGAYRRWTRQFYPESRRLLQPV